MKQKNSYSIKSTKRCACGCGKRLKQNLVDKNPKAEYIFKHFPNSKKNRSSANRNRRQQSQTVPMEVANES